LPAILVDHRGRMAAQRYGGLVLPADLGCTLRELIDPGSGASREADDPRRGRSLADLFAAGRFEAWTAGCRDRAICRGEHGTAVATPAWHLVLPRDVPGPPRPRLYAKPDDYFEVSDVADRCPEVAEELAALVAGDPRRAWTTSLSAAARLGV